MEVRFENRYEITKRLSNELYNKLLFHDVVIFIYIMSILSVIINVAFYFIERSVPEDSISAMIVLLGISLVYTGFALIRRKRWEKDNLNCLSAQSSKRCIRVTDKYEIIDEDETLLYTYNFFPINTLKETKNLIMLQMEPKKWLVFKKNAFTVGIYEDFRAFLISCYPRYKIKKNTKA